MGSNNNDSVSYEKEIWRLKRLRMEGEVLSFSEFEYYAAMLVCTGGFDQEDVLIVGALSWLKTDEMEDAIDRFIRGECAMRLLNPEEHGLHFALRWFDSIASSMRHSSSNEVPDGLDDLDVEIAMAGGLWSKDLLERIEADGKDAISQIEFSEHKHDFYFMRD